VHEPTLVWERLRERLSAVFFRHFFRLLFVSVSLSQWAVLWWFVLRPIQSVPWAAHVIGPALFYHANRWLALRAQERRYGRRRPSAWSRLYYRFAFTSLFCCSFLLLTGALWVTAKVLLGAIPVEARTVQAGQLIDTDVDVLFRWLASAGAALIAVAFTYGYTVGQRRLRVTHLTLRLRNAATSLRGLRIVQISDIHIGDNLDRRELEHFVARVNDLRPDLICITGDIVDAPSADLEEFLPVLARLRAAYGVFAILGNHDHYAGADRVQQALQAYTAFRLLRDHHTVIDVNGTRLHILGVDDHGRDWARGVRAVPFLTSALAAIGDHEPVLLLCHRPDVFPQAAAGGVALMLSGHTHGGQIAVPWLNGRMRNLAEFITPFDRGLFERDGSYLYVNCGLGVTGQRIRLCTPREITVIDVDVPAASDYACASTAAACAASSASGQR
jgi:predicted MPP superfamily phosphohydrolase